MCHDRFTLVPTLAPRPDTKKAEIVVFDVSLFLAACGLFREIIGEVVGGL